MSGFASSVTNGRLPPSSIASIFNVTPHPTATIVPTPNDSQHMALHYPEKSLVWQSILGHYFPLFSFDPDILWTALVFLRIPSTSFSYPQSLWLQVVGTTLHTIWLAHWAHHFHNIPILPTPMIPAAHTAIASPLFVPRTSLVPP